MQTEKKVKRRFAISLSDFSRVSVYILNMVNRSRAGPIIQNWYLWIWTLILHSNEAANISPEWLRWWILWFLMVGEAVFKSALNVLRHYLIKHHSVTDLQNLYFVIMNHVFIRQTWPYCYVLKFFYKVIYFPFAHWMIAETQSKCQQRSIKGITEPTSVIYEFLLKIWSLSMCFDRNTIDFEKKLKR